MSCPVEPEEFEALVPDQNDTICEKMRKMIDFQRLFVEWYSCWFNEDGTLKDEIIDEFCANECVGAGGTTSTTSSEPVDDQDFNYTDGDEVDYVVPEGVTSLHYRVWGGGAGAGGGAGFPLAPSGTPEGAGGGGGGGGFIEGNLIVTPLETLKFRVGGGGSGAPAQSGSGGAGFSGSSGQSSYIKRSSTILVEGFGGSLGAGGTISSGGSGGAGGSSNYEALASTSVTQVVGGAGVAGQVGPNTSTWPGGNGGNGGSGGVGGGPSVTGSVPGGGGGGGNSGFTIGGAGGNGRISIG